MTRHVAFHGNGWDDYCYWQEQDKKTLRRINKLIKDIDRQPYEGLGSPEPLRHDLSGYWSREIDKFNRLVYRIEDNEIQIAQCRAHYDD